MDPHDIRGKRTCLGFAFHVFVYNKTSMSSREKSAMVYIPFN
jgi:hypothetical protein